MSDFSKSDAFSSERVWLRPLPDSHSPQCTRPWTTKASTASRPSRCACEEADAPCGSAALAPGHPRAYRAVFLVQLCAAVVLQRSATDGAQHVPLQAMVSLQVHARRAAAAPKLCKRWMHGLCTGCKRRALHHRPQK